jgi:hypothetical protein
MKSLQIFYGHGAARNSFVGTISTADGFQGTEKFFMPFEISTSLATDDEGSLALCFWKLQQNTKQVFQCKTEGIEWSNESTTVGKKNIIEFRCSTEFKTALHCNEQKKGKNSRSALFTALLINIQVSWNVMILDSLTLRMEALRCSEMSITACQSTGLNIPENFNLCQHSHQKITSQRISKLKFKICGILSCWITWLWRQKYYTLPERWQVFSSRHDVISQNIWIKTISRT